MEASAKESGSMAEGNLVHMQAADANVDRDPYTDAYADAELERRNEAMERIIEKARRLA